MDALRRKTIALDCETHALLEELADREGCTKTQLVRGLIRAEFKKPYFETRPAEVNR